MPGTVDQFMGFGFNFGMVIEPLLEDWITVLTNQMVFFLIMDQIWTRYT